MKREKIVSVLLLVVIVISMIACTNGRKDKDNNSEKVSTEKTSTEKESDNNDPAETMETDAEEEGNLDYSYGLNKTFHSNEPVTYSMMYSDHEAYPYQEDWRLWSAITEKSNVKFDLNIIARADYDDKKSLLINAGEASYIIPKTYDESAFVTGGAVLPVSDWVQYMPNYMNFVEAYHMEEDLKTITKEDGKYYKLPGMWEKPASTGSEYTLVIRKDIFDAAGVDVKALEKDWSWEDLYEALLKVQKHVGGGVVWSDKWKGESLLKIVGQTYDVLAGWAAGDGMQYDSSSDTWYFAPASDDYKDFLTTMSKFVSSGLLDSETFTQEDQTAESKFYTGQTYIMGANRSTLQVYKDEMNKTLGEGNFELYYIVIPKAKNNYQTENSRLENGIMIATKALDELGEEGLIKMLRFIDWLWYSDEGKDLVRWGVEGETYTKENGEYKLNPEITYVGLNPGAPKALNVDYGFGNGVFMYGGTYEHAASMLSDELKEFFSRLNSYRDMKPLNPTVVFTEDEQETMNLIKTPLIDYVKSATLQFITGQLNIESDWNSYIESCKSNNYENYVEMYNNAYRP